MNFKLTNKKFSKKKEFNLRQRKILKKENNDFFESIKKKY